MEIWQAVLLGAVQGFTEFLPVSSSGHLVFMQKLFGVEGGLFIPIVLHLGTLVAVFAEFYKEIINLFKKPFSTLGFLILATVPAATVGLFAGEFIENFISGRFTGFILAAMFMCTAALLWLTGFAVRRRRKKNLPLCGINCRTAIPMGLAQAVAVFPGVSRSGATICAGIMAGGEEEEVAKFSFLMSVPVILGSFAVDLFKGLQDGGIAGFFSSGGPIPGVAVALGFAVSAAAGIISVKLTLRAVKRESYGWFSLYLALISVVCILLNVTGRLGYI